MTLPGLEAFRRGAPPRRAHMMTSTREKWRGQKYDFYLIAHEHLYVFRKLTMGENPRDYRYSVKWWS